MKKHKILFWLILLALSACEMILAWRVKGFSDFYVKYIFPVFSETYGRIAGLVSFSYGEILLYLAVVYVVFTLVLWLFRFVWFVNKKDTFKRFSRANSAFFIKLIILIILLQVQNCFIMYHTTPIFAGTENDLYEANREDLITFRETLVKRANALATEFERNSKGEIVYNGDIASVAKISMQGMGEDAKRRVKEGKAELLDEKLMLLTGYYSKPKPFFKSDFFSQQNICGYYFPFSLEANYNNLMYIANFPESMCHELSHLKGFIYEDEASFLAYLGCMYSNDNFFIYSATLEALAYVEVEVKKELALLPEVRKSLTPISDLALFDSVFLTDEAWALVEKDSVLDTDFVANASETFLDTNIKLNGVSDGIISYSRVVNLLLKYYFGAM